MNALSERVWNTTRCQTSLQVLLSGLFNTNALNQQARKIATNMLLQIPKAKLATENSFPDN